MNTKIKYVLPAFAAVFALMFVAATPYVIAEPGQEKQWADGSSKSDATYDHSVKKDIKQDMAEKINRYCKMSADEQSSLIAEYNKTEEIIAKMNEYCSLDEAGKQAFIEEYSNEYKKHSEDKMKYDSKKHHMTIKVKGFTGAIPIPEMTKETDMKAVHEDLKSKVTVKFSEAASLAEDAGLDVMKGSIGIAVNENGDKFVVWTLVEINMESKSETMSTTVFVVDAADATNTTQVTKEFDHSMMMAEGRDNRYSHDKQQEGGNYEKTLSDPAQIENKIAKIEKKLSDQGTGNVAKDNLKSQFLEILKQLQNAIADGDDVQADSLREQLNDLRSQMTEIKWHN
ncbi:MAG: hypothetical protein OEL56_04105 [Nitrosopumilus sp.]|nr:hypothetical protein [Nitrosopumilus sp.]MDH3489611.1 hypothetical protein [Nitrosopumilus sp.]MDH3516609.1 hypothetical protein [Nitrosopumilus sp.]MDH3565076.1 hypothetical protein [Nitrosopumilus sp.]MDH5416499.1 hypothetical protein [Nitrosopumilus sp.]